MGNCSSRQRKRYVYKGYELFLLDLIHALESQPRENQLLLARFKDSIPLGVNYEYDAFILKIVIEHVDFYRSETPMKKHMILEGITYRQRVRLNEMQYRWLKEMVPTVEPLVIVQYDYEK